jgi:hypothetical protein
MKRDKVGVNIIKGYVFSLPLGTYPLSLMTLKEAALTDRPLSKEQ